MYFNEIRSPDNEMSAHDDEYANELESEYKTKETNIDFGCSLRSVASLSVANSPILRAHRTQFNGQMRIAQMRCAYVVLAFVPPFP